MDSRALMTSVRPAANAAPTYGELLELARGRAEAACRDGSGPFASADEAARAVSGYERYLAVIGRHLQLIAVPGMAATLGPSTSLPVLHQLIQRMALLTMSSSQASRWGAAADALATAHDLLATHVGSAGERRTAEVESLADPRQRDAATHSVLQLLEPPLAHRDHLLAAVSAAVRADPQAPSSRAVAAHLRQSTDAIAQLSRRYVATTTTHGVTSEIGSLEPAALSPSAVSGPRRFEDSVQALRVLRLLSYRQTTGAEQASPGSLHDLARLGQAVTSDPDRWLPAAETPVGRVQRANALDQMGRAASAWQDATVTLGQHVRGLTRAPRLYADAIAAVQQAHTHAAVRRAVLASLPRLGNEAAVTVNRLAQTGSLTVAVKRTGRFQESWRLVTPDEGVGLAACFTSAAEMSRTANLSVAQLDAMARQRSGAQQAATTARLRRGRVTEGRLS